MIKKSDDKELSILWDKLSHQKNNIPIAPLCECENKKRDTFKDSYLTQPRRAIVNKDMMVIVILEMSQKNTVLPYCFIIASETAQLYQYYDVTTETFHETKDSLKYKSYESLLIEQSEKEHKQRELDQYAHDHKKIDMPNTCVNCHYPVRQQVAQPWHFTTDEMIRFIELFHSYTIKNGFNELDPDAIGPSWQHCFATLFNGYLDQYFTYYYKNKMTVKYPKNEILECFGVSMQTLLEYYATERSRPLNKLAFFDEFHAIIMRSRGEMTVESLKELLDLLDIENRYERSN